jgi:hypothetical protein
MDNTLDSIQSILIKNDYTSISDLAAQASKIDNRIKSNYESDTLDLDFAKKLDEYKIMRKSFEILNLSNSQMINDIESEKIALKKLKADIDKGNGERNKYPDYIEFEKNKVSKLNDLLLVYLNLRETTLKSFNDVNNEINAFSFSLINKSKKV